MKGIVIKVVNKAIDVAVCGGPDQGREYVIIGARHFEESGDEVAGK